MHVTELLAKHGIKLESYAPGRYYTTCPKCSAKRRKEHQDNEVLGVTIENGGAHWGCNHCGWTGPEKGSGKGGNGARPELPVHLYRDRDGVIRFRKVRNHPGRDPKCWFQHLDDDRWVKGSGGADTKILYRLDEVTKAIAEGRTIACVEGEKDADNLWALGIAATCNAHGAHDPTKKQKPKWYRVHSEQLAGADIVVLNDNDPAGYEHADTTCRLSLGVAKRVRRLDLAKHWEGMPPRADVSDWLARGHTRAELDTLITTAPDYVPQGEPTPAVDDAAELEKLARMPALDYERARKDAGKRLGISRLTLLDALVKAKRSELGLDKADGKAGHAIEFQAPEPWPHPVDGFRLLDALSTVIGEYVITERHYCDAAALWIVHTYLLDYFQVTPRAAIRSPIKRCGKSTLLRVFNCLVFKPLPTSSVTASVTFRVIEKHRPCLLIDEADMLLRSKDESKDLYSVLLDGQARGGQTLRNVGVGDDYEPRAFNNFAAVAIASIGKLLDTLTDRSIVIELKRRKRSEQVKRRFRFDHVEHLTELARQVMRWVIDNGERIGASDPTMPDSIVDPGAADNWRPLLAIADAASGEWPERARTAAVQVCGFNEEDEDARLELLLGDIRDVFDEGDEDHISSAHLIEHLCEIVPRPWAEYGRSGKPLTQNQLARLLKPLGIAPQKVGPREMRANGYLRAHFAEAFERYLGQEGVSQPDNRTQCDEIRTFEISQPDSLAGVSPVAKCEKPNNDGLESGCPVAKGGNGEDCHICAKCGEPGATLKMAFGNDPSVWLHRKCEDDWIEMRMRGEGL